MADCLSSLAQLLVSENLEHMGLCTQLYPENLEPDSCGIRELGTWLYVHNYTRRILNLTPVVSENLEHGSMYPIIPGES